MLDPTEGTATTRQVLVSIPPKGARISDKTI